MKKYRFTEQDLTRLISKILREDDYDEVELEVAAKVPGAKERMKEIQRALIGLGYNLGTYGPNKDGIDGVYGDTTKNAIKEFQKKNGIKDTGWVGVVTAPVLGVEPMIRGTKFVSKKKTGSATVTPPKVTKPKQTGVEYVSPYNCIAVSKEVCNTLSPSREVQIDSGGETRCAAYMHKCLSEYDDDFAGNAWGSLAHMIWRGVASPKYNVFKNLDWNTISNEVKKLQIDKKLCQCHSQDHADKKCGGKIASFVRQILPDKSGINLSNLELGDIVGMYYNASTNKGMAFCSGLSFDKNGVLANVNPFEFNTHVGFVVSIKNGVPIILHNIDGNKVATPADQLLSKDNLMIAWVASDKKVKRSLQSQIAKKSGYFGNI